MKSNFFSTSVKVLGLTVLLTGGTGCARSIIVRIDEPLHDHVIVGSDQLDVQVFGTRKFGPAFQVTPDAFRAYLKQNDGDEINATSSFSTSCSTSDPPGINKECTYRGRINVFQPGREYKIRVRVCAGGDDHPHQDCAFRTRIVYRECPLPANCVAGQAVDVDSAWVAFKTGWAAKPMESKTRSNVDKELSVDPSYRPLECAGAEAVPRMVDILKSDPQGILMARAVKLNTCWNNPYTRYVLADMPVKETRAWSDWWDQARCWPIWYMGRQTPPGCN